MGIAKVYKFSAEWCGPCQVFAPIFDKVSKMEEFSNLEFKVFDVDVDDDETRKYEITNVPSLIFADENGKPIKKIIGAVPEGDFIQLLRDELSSDGKS